MEPEDRLPEEEEMGLEDDEVFRYKLLPKGLVFLGRILKRELRQAESAQDQAMLERLLWVVRGQQARTGIPPEVLAWVRANVLEGEAWFSEFCGRLRERVDPTELISLLVLWQMVVQTAARPDGKQEARR